MIKNAMTEAAKQAAATFLTDRACTVNEGLQYILQYIQDGEGKYPEATDFMKEVLAILCDQITPEQALG